MKNLVSAVTMVAVFIISFSSCKKSSTDLTADLTAGMVGTYTGTGTDSIVGVGGTIRQATTITVTKVDNSDIQITGTPYFPIFTASVALLSNGNYNLTVTGPSGIAGVIFPGNTVPCTYTPSTRTLAIAVSSTSNGTTAIEGFIGTH